MKTHIYFICRNYRKSAALILIAAFICWVPAGNGYILTLLQHVLPFVKTPTFKFIYEELRSANRRAKKYFSSIETGKYIHSWKPASNAESI